LRFKKSIFLLTLLFCSVFHEYQLYMPGGNVRRRFVVRRLIVLSAIFSVSALASSIGTCAPSAVSTMIGNPCTLGSAMFSNFTYSGNVDPAKVSVNFQMASNGTEYRVVLAPMSDAGLLKNFTFTDTITSTSSEIVGLKGQSDFSPGSTGELSITNTPGASFVLSPGHESGGPASITATNSVTTSATLTGAGANDANSGVSSVELDYVSNASPLSLLATAPVAVPEPASWGFLAVGLGALSLLRKRTA
jgi:hypothetical protein